MKEFESVFFITLGLLLAFAGAGSIESDSASVTIGSLTTILGFFSILYGAEVYEKNL